MLDKGVLRLSLKKNKYACKAYVLRVAKWLVDMSFFRVVVVNMIDTRVHAWFVKALCIRTYIYNVYITYISHIYIYYIHHTYYIYYIATYNYMHL